MSDHKVLTESKILEILKKVTGDKNVEIIELCVKAGIDKGENYSSDFLACDVTAKISGKLNEFHWVAKLPPEGRMVVHRGTHMEDKEIMMYSDVLPNLKNFLKDKDIQLHFVTSPYSEFHEDMDKVINSCLSAVSIVNKRNVTRSLRHALNYGKS